MSAIDPKLIEFDPVAAGETASYTLNVTEMSILHVFFVLGGVDDAEDLGECVTKICLSADTISLHPIYDLEDSSPVFDEVETVSKYCRYDVRGIPRVNFSMKNDSDGERSAAIYIMASIERD